MNEFNLNDLSKLDIKLIDKYCFEKGMLFANGEKETINGKTKVVNRVKTNQIRNVFSKIVSLRNYYKLNKNIHNKIKELNDREGISEKEKAIIADLNQQLLVIEEKIKRELYIIKYLVAYAKGRNPDIINFQQEMDRIITGAINSSNFRLGIENFFVIIEGFVAYHKYFNGD